MVAQLAGQHVSLQLSRVVGRDRYRTKMQTPPTTEGHDHAWCIGGCLANSSPRTRAHRASRYGIGPEQLDTLLGVLDGRCMVCLDCHAMVLDTARASRQVRGLICRFCKTRVATYEGSYGPDARFYTPCRCRKSTDNEWESRIKAALAQYLSRTAPGAGKNREHVDILIRDLSTNGPDPLRVWDRAPLTALPRLPEITPFAETNYGDVLPLARSRCRIDCRDHPEHIYIACFSTPTTLRDIDKRHIFMHYVGWTRQQPPVHRVKQHGNACMNALVAIVPGSESEEGEMKVSGGCPRCGQPLGSGTRY